MSIFSKLSRDMALFDPSMPPEEYLQGMIQTVCASLGYCFGAIIEGISGNGSGRVLCAYNLPEDYVGSTEEISIWFSSIFRNRTVKTGHAFVITDPVSQIRTTSWHELLRNRRINILACLPLYGGGRVFGACILFDARRRHISDEELNALEQVTVNMSVAAACGAYSGQLNRRFKKLQDEITLLKRSEKDLKLSNRELSAALQSHLEQNKVRTEQLESLWNVTRIIDLEFKTLCDKVLDEIKAMTQSKYALYGFLNEDASVLSIYSWSKDVLEDCQIQEEYLEFQVDKGGLWTVPVRERKTLIINDYNASHPGKKGTVTGHVLLTRLLCVPVLSHGRVAALAVVANKPSDYTREDARQVEAFCTNVQIILERKHAEDELNKHITHLDLLVKERTAELEDEIRKHRETEKALRRSEQDKTNILETMSEMVIYLDKERKILWVNKAAAASVGLRAEDLVGRYCYSVWHQRNRPCPKCPGKDIYEKGESNDGEIVTPDGRIWHFKGYPVKDDNGGVVGMVEITEEITRRRQVEEEKKKLELQLHQAQKMKAIGTLAGGIAHDFNNILMGIQGHASLMMMNIDSEHPVFKHVEGIGELVQRGSDLTRQLLGFARGGKYHVKSTDMNMLIENSSNMFGRTKKEIRIHKKYQDGLWPVEVDRGQMEQVLLNLFINAWQAMPGGGDLYLETKNEVLDDTYNKPFEVTPGNYVKISVTDTGIGMDDATCQRVFEPFFTTKDIGRGTGLGLASAYGIIKNHGGIINVYSEKGLGTTFNIYLPASDKAVLTEKKKPEARLLKGKETILFVDDEEVLTDVGQNLLTQLGYRVFTAQSGKDAIDIFRKHRGAIDLVILDMVMPDMGGAEVYDRIKQINPDIRVILSSGYSLNGQAGDIMERGCDDFIQKPFNISTLSAKIRDLLSNA